MDTNELYKRLATHMHTTHGQTIVIAKTRLDEQVESIQMPIGKAIKVLEKSGTHSVTSTGNYIYIQP